MTTETLPPISASLQTAIRTYGLANGWKNAARELAYGPVRAESPKSSRPSIGADTPDWLKPQQLPGPKLKRNIRRGLIAPVPGGHKPLAGGWKMGACTQHNFGHEIAHISLKAGASSCLACRIGMTYHGIKNAGTTCRWPLEPHDGPEIPELHPAEAS